MIETIPSGTVLHGRYRIERVLGSGGFGHVYLAIDLMGNQQYAVKEYLVAGPSGQEQLKHEANVLRQLHHPNLPAFQDAFIERGRYFVVLNYIEGNDLTDLLRMTRQRNEVIPIRKVVGWILSICDAVLFLHNQQPPVIHRDIKPDNIRITSNGTAILVDLGNAKAAADGARTLFFIRHQGTPGYAPPEQYPGGSGTDARSDVYALGGTLYFALTAHEPPSVSVRNQSLQQGKPDLPTLQEVLANNPPEESPEAQAARQFRLGVNKPAKPAPRHLRHVAQLGTLPPEVLKQLNRIIMRSMGLKPKDRYPSVAEFANDLKKVMAALPEPPPARVADPHSTQPDLPLLYESLQAAQDNAKQNPAAAGSSTAPMPDPTPQADATRTCPRCGATLLAQASFCPQCGTALSRAAGSNPATAQQPGHDIAAEETMLIRPQAQPQKMPINQGAATSTPQVSVDARGSRAQQVQVSPPPAVPTTPPISQDKSVNYQGASSTRTAAPTTTQTPPARPVASSQSRVAGSSAATRQPSQASSSGRELNPKMIIIGLVVLAVLVVIGIILLTLLHSSHAHATHALASLAGMIPLYNCKKLSSVWRRRRG